MLLVVEERAPRCGHSDSSLSSVTKEPHVEYFAPTPRPENSEYSPLPNSVGSEEQEPELGVVSQRK